MPSHSSRTFTALMKPAKLLCSRRCRFADPIDSNRSPVACLSKVQAIKLETGLQAEVFWLREQLDRERSKANTTPAATVTPADARRLALETAQKQREVSNLQTQVTCLRQHLLEAEAMLHSQTADLALCKR